MYHYLANASMATQAMIQDADSLDRPSASYCHTIEHSLAWQSALRLSRICTHHQTPNTRTKDENDRFFCFRTLAPALDGLLLLNGP